MLCSLCVDRSQQTVHGHPDGIAQVFRSSFLFLGFGLTHGKQRQRHEEAPALRNVKEAE